MNKIIHYLSIEKLALHGYGLGYAEGKAVFVPFTMPGDCVNVNVSLEKKDVIFGSVAEYIDASDLSVLPQCDAFGGDNACGGCDWLMAPYPTQVYWKTELIKQVFEPLKLQDMVKKTVPSPQPQSYRNKSFLPAGTKQGGIYFGMYARYSHKVVPHKRCLLQPAVMDEILEEIVSFTTKVKLDAYDETSQKGILRHVGIRLNQNQDEILLILVTKGAKFPFTKQFIQTITKRFPQIAGIVQNINRSLGNVVLGEEDKLLFGSPYLNEKLGSFKFRLHYKSFYQINNATTIRMYDHLKENLNSNDTVLDAFCGVGSIGLYIADKVKAVHGVETIPEAVIDANYNAELNNLHNAAFIEGKVEDVLPGLMQQNKYTAMILDPPRKGLDNASLLAIGQEKIPLILYVSCNPMTLVRDLRTLLEQGYKVEEITPFDMFPQTWHIETVVKLTFGKAGMK